MQNKINELKELRIELKKRHNYGKNVEIGDFTYGNPSILSWEEGNKLKIGKFCSIASDVTIFLGGEHRSDWVTTYPFNALLKSYNNIKGHPKSKGDVVIGNDVWIAMGATILSGVTIGDGAIVGANSLISKDVEPYSIVGGNPGKLIRYRFDSKIIKELLEIKWWNKKLDEIAEIIPLLQSENVSEIIKRYSTNPNAVSSKDLIKR